MKRVLCQNLLFLCLVIGVFSHKTHAQTVPSTVDPGRIPGHFEEPQKPRSSFDPIAPEIIGPRGSIPENADTLTFTLERVTIEGSSVYSEKDLLVFYENMVGQEVSVAFLYELADVITSHYRNQGYILSRVIVPPQKLKEGKARLKVVEGYVNSVTVNGQNSPARQKLTDYGKKIVAARPLNIKELERYLLLMRDIPGHDVEALLQPAKEGETGSAELVLDVTYKKYEASIGADNRGTKFLGPLQNFVKVSANSPFKLGEKFQLRYIGTDASIPWNQEELRSFEFGYAMPLGNEGTTLSLTTSQALAFPSSNLELLDTQIKNKSITIDMQHPFIRSRRTNFFAGLQFSFSNARTDILNVRTAEDRIRAIRINGRYDWLDSWNGITQIYAEVSQGLNLFGNSSKNSNFISRTFGRSDFTKVNLEISRIQRLTDRLNLYAAVAGQYSPHRLLSSEEFGVGGSVFGRGHDPSEITGDNGVAAKAELQYTGNTSFEFLPRYQLYGFTDFGAVFQTENVSNGRDSLVSIGMGSRMNFSETVTGTFEVAQPLTRDVGSRGPDDGQDPRIFFSLTARY